MRIALGRLLTGGLLVQPEEPISSFTPLREEVERLNVSGRKTSAIERTVVAMFSENARQLHLPLVIRIAPFALLIVAALFIRVMRRTAVLEGRPIGDTTPDSSWILGRLYFNRADPTLFVERRVGLGYTLNLGNPWSWLVMIVFVTGIATPAARALTARGCA